MKIKRIMRDTVGVSFGAVGINAANSIGGPMGNVLGTSMAAGMAMNVGKYGSSKRRRR